MAAGTGFGDDAEGDQISRVEGLSAYSNASLFGDGGNNWFSVGGRDAVVDGRGGDDIIESTAYGHEIDGGSGRDTVSYHEFTDDDEDILGVRVDLRAGTAQDLENLYRTADGLTDIENVIGTWRDDTLLGDGADNVLDGGDGDDLLNGRGGDDALTGGGGFDTFQFVNSRFDNDDDVVTDFTVGYDRIDFSDNANSIDSFQEFLDDSQQVSADVVTDTGDGTITLQNVLLTDLSAGDFLF